MKNVAMKPYIIGLLVMAGGWACVPYNIEDFKLIKAQTLRMDIKEWHLRKEPQGFGYTNKTDKCWLISTNIPTKGQRVEGVIMLESTLFQGRGCLIGTDSGEIYWYDGKMPKQMKGSTAGTKTSER